VHELTSCISGREAAIAVDSVTEQYRVTGAVISPDGKYVAYSDPTGVYIRNIDSGATRPPAKHLSRLP